MGRIIHFEIPVEDLDRAGEFYSGLFGWDIQKWEGGDYWLVTTGTEAPGIDGALAHRRDDFKTPVNVIGVDDVDAMLTKVKDAGGEVAVPKMPIPGVGYAAYCLDTEGNSFGLFESDESVTAPDAE